MPRAVVLATSLLVALAAPSRAAPSEELRMVLEGLRTDERSRVERSVGPAEALPLYRVALEVDPERRELAGTVSITLRPHAPLTALHLRVTPNASSPGAVRVAALEVDGDRRTLRHVDRSLLEVPLPAPLPAGRPVTLAFKLAARVPTLAERGSFGGFVAGPDVVSLVGVVPMVAPVKEGGSLAEGPSAIGDVGTFDPSNFIVAVTVPSPWRALSGGRFFGAIPDRRGCCQRYTYALSAVRDLPVLVARDYASQSRTVGDVVVESWYARGDERGGHRALEHAARALEQLEAQLGPYPFPTLRLVEARMRDGVGEAGFSGLVALSSHLYRGGASPLSVLGLGEERGLKRLSSELKPRLMHLFDTTFEQTVDHALAHQYFSGVVGSDPVATPVADEALAQHVALLLVEWHRGRRAADELRATQLRSAYQLHRMLGGRDGEADRPTWAFKSSFEYAALVLGKAPLLLDAMRARLGDEAWLALLRAYVEEERYRWATATTLLELAARRHPDQGAALRALHARWWNERHGDEDIGVVSGELSGAMGGLDGQMIEAYRLALERQLRR